MKKLSLFYHPSVWQIEPHQDASGKREYLQDKDIKPKWLIEVISKKHFPIKLRLARPLSWKDFSVVHHTKYIKQLQDGNKSELAKYSWVDWGPKFLKAQKYLAGIVYDAAKTALKEGISGGLSTPGHHALPGCGSGFASFNYEAIALSKLLNETNIKKIAIIDLDLHYGNGTTEIFKGNPRVCIFDVYGLKHLNSTRPIKGNKDKLVIHQATDLNNYFQFLRNKLEKFLLTNQPDLVLYLSGMDIAETDRYGGISGMNKEKIKQREKFVFELVKKLGKSLVFILGGGYIKYTNNEGIKLSEKKKENKTRELTQLHLLTIKSALHTKSCPRLFQ